MIKKFTFYLALTLLTSTHAFTQQWRQLPPNANLNDAVSYDVALEEGGTFYAVYATLNSGTGYYDIYFDYYNALDGWQNLLTYATTNSSPTMSVKVVSINGIHYAMAPTNNASRMTLFQFGGLSAYALVSQDFTSYSVATVGTNWNFSQGAYTSEIFLTYTSSITNRLHQFDYNTQTWNDRGNPFNASGTLATEMQVYAEDDSVFVAAKYNATPANRIKLAGAARSNWTWSTIGSPGGDIFSFNGVADTVTGNDAFYIAGDVLAASTLQQKFIIAKDNGIEKEIPVALNTFGNASSLAIDYDTKPDFATTANGHFFLARTSIAGAENAIFRRDLQTGGWTQVAPMFANDATLPVDKRLGVSQTMSRLMVGYIDQAPTPDEHVLLLTNNPPVVTDPGSDIDLLCGGSTQTTLSQLLITDDDADYITFLGATSSDNTLIDPSTVSVNIFNNAGVPAEVYADAEIAAVASPQNVTITYSFSDGFDQVQHTVTYQILPAPTVSWTDDTLRFCTNGDLVDLYDYVSYPGGDFTANETDYEGHYYDPTLVNDPTNFYFDLHYDIDNGACFAEAYVTIGAYPAPDADLSTTPATNCGSNDGTAEVTIGGGTAPYVFVWNNGNYTDQQLIGLSPGMVHVDVTDANGCEVVADAIVENNGVSITGVVTPVTCFGDADGAIDITVTGLLAPLTVLWSNGYSTEDVANLQPGTHEVWITDATDCYVVQTFDVPQPDELRLNIVGSSTTCGFTEGTVTLDFVTGGNFPYTYSWNTGSTADNISNVGSGIYTLTVTDDKGCVASDNAYVYDTDAPYIQGWDVEPATCSESDGAIYTYIIPIGNNTQISWSNGSSEESIDSIPAGTYTADVFNDEGCHTYNVFDVAVKAPERQPICVVTVDSTTSTNLVVWEKIGEQGIDHFNIYRETFVPGQFQKIDTVQNANMSIFNDVVASPIARSWKYRITAVNACDVESVPSVAHKTIHLTTIDLGNGDFKVVWNFYEGTNYNAFNVYRFTNSTGWEQIATTPAGQPYFIDTPPNTVGLDYMVDFEVDCTADLEKAQDFNSARSNKDKGQFSAGNGTGDSNNGLIETNLGDGTVYLYPNPVSGEQVFVEVDNIPTADYTIVSVTGQQVASGQLAEGVSTIGLQELRAGVYIMHLVHNDDATSLRFIIE